MDILNAMKLTSNGVKMTRLDWIDLVREYPDDPDGKWKRSWSCPAYFVYNKEYDVLDVYNRYRMLIHQYANKFNPFGFNYEDIIADDYVVFTDELLDTALKDGIANAK